MASFGLPWKSPQSIRMRALSVSSRNCEPVTVVAAPKKVNFTGSVSSARRSPPSGTRRLRFSATMRVLRATLGGLRVGHAIGTFITEGDRVGLLDGRKGLIFGIANDHSIAWGIAQALHREGATLGFSPVESLIEKRVRPLATQLGVDFVEPCDVQDDAQIDAVMDAWRKQYGEIDFLVHALAFARKEELSG